MAFRKFCLTVFTDESETPFRFLDTFDAAVSVAVDLFKFIIRKLRNGERYVEENESEVRKDVHRRLKWYSKSISRFGKGGVIHNGSGTPLKSFFSKASTQLFKECSEMFKTGIDFF